MEEEEEYDVDEDEDDVKAELLSLCDNDDDEISLEHECKKNITARKLPRKRQQIQHNGTGRHEIEESCIPQKQAQATTQIIFNV